MEDNNMTNRNTPIENSAEFQCGEELYMVQINDGTLTLNCVRSSNTSHTRPTTSFDHSIPLLQVISTSYEACELRVDRKGRPIVGNRCLSMFNVETKQCFSLAINFWMKKKNHRRKLQTIKLQSHEEKYCVEWKKIIDLKVEAELKNKSYVRPHNLLLFICPCSGKKVGRKVYKNIISPLFKLAGIRETVIYTEYGGHAKEYIESNDISEYDGIIAGGGDGTLSEVANAVLVKEQEKKGVSLDTKSTTLAKPSVRIGTLPLGTANTCNWSLQGANDYETAAIQIICGETHPFDVSSVFNDDGKFEKFSIVGFSQGFFADALKIAERMRRLGPLRYDIAMVRMLLQHKAYACEVSYLPSSPLDPVDIRNEKRCRYPCTTCLKGQNDFLHKTIAETDAKKDSDFPSSTKSQNETKSWKVTRGRFHMINVCLESMIYDKCPEGFAPAAHLADGAGDLVLLHSTSRKNIFRCLLSLRQPRARLDFPFMELHRVKAFRYQTLLESELEPSEAQEESLSVQADHPLQSSNTENNDLGPDTSNELWTVDGDFLNSRSLTACVHRGLIDMFGKGIEEEH